MEPLNNTNNNDNNDAPQESYNKQNQVHPARKHVLPPKPYKLKVILMFSEFFLFFAYIYYYWISSMVSDIRSGAFDFLSPRMFSFYILLGLTAAIILLLLLLKWTKSAKTRFERDNEVRQDEQITYWLTGFDWGWPILFTPTVVLMLLFGITGFVLDWWLPSSRTASTIQDLMGGIIIIFMSINAAVVIFKLRPVVVVLLGASVVIVLLMLGLHGKDTFVNFFRSFKHLGIRFEPLGYIILAYIWSVFIRIIWLRSLFFYWVFTPNRLEIQSGLSESNDMVDRDEIRVKIDTDDVMLRIFNVGIITYYFPRLDRREITNVVLGIRKKADYVNKAASRRTVE
jgi:hypothetical protein